MHADISRDSYRPGQNYSAVVAQQGRALLDADANEQADLQLGALRRFIVDVIGQAAGPSDNIQTPFAVSVTNGVLTFSTGRYYVDGIEVQVGNLGLGQYDYYNQPFAHFDPANDHLPTTDYFAVYLKVFERLITTVEDPAVREVALGDLAPDTAARRQIVWQVIATDKLSTAGQAITQLTPATYAGQWGAFMNDQTFRFGPMAARAVPPTAQDLCAVAPDSSYRGCENQLYRVEVHSSLGTNADGSVVPATFKWSRENGSVVFPINSFDGNATVVLAHLGRDDRLSLEIGDWVELVDDAYALRLDDVAKPLRQVIQIDRVTNTVTLNAGAANTVGTKQALHPLLRRWDQRPAAGDATLAGDGALTIVPADPFSNSTGWVDLEDGVQVLFPHRSNIGAPIVGDPVIPPGGYNGGDYRRGDYWLIPARTVTGGVEWPTDGNAPSLLPPHGPEIHYAPICLVKTADGTTAVDSRMFFPSISKPFSQPAS